MIYNLSLVLLFAVAFVTQEFMPEVVWGYRAKVLAVPLVFFSTAVTVSYPLMLFYAFIVGLVWDARFVVPPITGDNGVVVTDVALGYSILLLGLTGSLMQGIRPLFSKGRWELPVIMTGVATATLMTLEYLLVNFMRGGFVFPREVWSKILASSLLTMIGAPLLFFLLYRIAKATGYKIRTEGLRSKYR